MNKFYNDTNVEKTSAFLFHNGELLYFHYKNGCMEISVIQIDANQGSCDIQSVCNVKNDTGGNTLPQGILAAVTNVEDNTTAIVYNAKSNRKKLLKNSNRKEKATESNSLTFLFYELYRGDNVEEFKLQYIAEYSLVSLNKQYTNICLVDGPYAFILCPVKQELIVLQLNVVDFSIHSLHAPLQILSCTNTHKSIEAINLSRNIAKVELISCEIVYMDQCRSNSHVLVHFAGTNGCSNKVDESSFHVWRVWKFNAVDHDHNFTSCWYLSNNLNQQITCCHVVNNMSWISHSIYETKLDFAYKNTLSGSDGSKYMDFSPEQLGTVLVGYKDSKKLSLCSNGVPRCSVDMPGIPINILQLQAANTSHGYAVVECNETNNNFGNIILVYYCVKLGELDMKVHQGFKHVGSWGVSVGHNLQDNQLLLLNKPKQGINEINLLQLLHRSVSVRLNNSDGYNITKLVSRQLKVASRMNLPKSSKGAFIQRISIAAMEDSVKAISGNLTQDFDYNSSDGEGKSCKVNLQSDQQTSFLKALEYRLSIGIHYLTRSRKVEADKLLTAQTLDQMIANIWLTLSFPNTDFNDFIQQSSKMPQTLISKNAATHINMETIVELNNGEEMNSMNDGMDISNKIDHLKVANNKCPLQFVSCQQKNVTTSSPLVYFVSVKLQNVSTCILYNVGISFVAENGQELACQSLVMPKVLPQILDTTYQRSMRENKETNYVDFDAILNCDNLGLDRMQLDTSIWVRWSEDLHDVGAVACIGLLKLSVSEENTPLLPSNLSLMPNNNFHIDSLRISPCEIRGDSYGVIKSALCRQKLRTIQELIICLEAEVQAMKCQAITSSHKLDMSNWTYELLMQQGKTDNAAVKLFLQLQKCSNMQVKKNLTKDIEYF